MIRLSLITLLFVACATHSSSTNEPLLQGDTCEIHMDQTNCVAETGCQWFDLGRPCPANGTPCQSGVCQGPGSGSGSGSNGSGVGSGSAACACSNGGVCYEQVGGPAQQGGTEPQIECTIPTAGTGDACARITGQGTCSDSTTVFGLCLCDNGIR